MIRTLGATVLAMVLPALVSAQSLGQVAEKEKERRKQHEKTGAKAPVISEEELKSNKGRLANDPSEPGAATPGTTSTAPITPPSGRDEQSWRARASQARARVAQATRTYETFNRQYLAPGESFVDTRTGKTLVRDKEQLQRLVAEAKASMVAAQKALDDLEESARRQSIPPGWLR